MLLHVNINSKVTFACFFVSHNKTIIIAVNSNQEVIILMSLLKKCIAECIGTAVLVLVACGVAAFGGDNVAVSLAFGLVIVAMAYSIGNISGCHINPAVSFAMVLDKRMSWKEFGCYVAAQCIGAIIGSLLLALFMGSFEHLGGNEVQAGIVYQYGDVGSLFIGFAAEIVLTFIFVIAVLGATDTRYHDGKHAGIVIGLALALVHLLGLNITGTSVNPARSLAPALLQAFAGNTTSLQQIWIWLLAPMIGAALAAIAYRALTAHKESKNAEAHEEASAESNEEAAE